MGKLAEVVAVVHQLKYLSVKQVSHISRELPTIQELPQWTQTKRFGKENQSTMVKFMVKNNGKNGLMTSKSMVLIKKKLLTKESHMLLLFSEFPEALVVADGQLSQYQM